MKPSRLVIALEVCGELSRFAVLHPKHKFQMSKGLNRRTRPGGSAGGFYWGA